jgi:hypothetical protein
LSSFKWQCLVENTGIGAAVTGWQAVVGPQKDHPLAQTWRAVFTEAGEGNQCLANGNLIAVD